MVRLDPSRPPPLIRCAGLLLALASAGPAAAAASSTPHLDLSRLRSPYDASQGQQPAGVARTALERRFSRSGSGAAVGFLCGLQPSAVSSGGAAAYGVDPQGRFLGAQLRFGFR